LERKNRKTNECAPVRISIELPTAKSQKLTAKSQKLTANSQQPTAKKNESNRQVHIKKIFLYIFGTDVLVCAYIYYFRFVGADR
jgi:hypothetical protein